MGYRWDMAASATSWEEGREGRSSSQVGQAQSADHTPIGCRGVGPGEETVRASVLWGSRIQVLLIGQSCALLP